MERKQYDMKDLGLHEVRSSKFLHESVSKGIHEHSRSVDILLPSVLDACTDHCESIHRICEFVKSNIFANRRQHWVFHPESHAETLT